MNYYQEIYSLPFRTSLDTKSREFQYRLLNRCLVTNIFLNKIGIIPSPACSGKEVALFVFSAWSFASNLSKSSSPKSEFWLLISSITSVFARRRFDDWKNCSSKPEKFQKQKNLKSPEISKNASGFNSKRISLQLNTWMYLHAQTCIISSLEVITWFPRNCPSCLLLLEEERGMRRVGTGTMVEEQIPILSRANLKKSAGNKFFFGYLTNRLHSFNCFSLEY